LHNPAFQHSVGRESAEKTGMTVTLFVIRLWLLMAIWERDFWRADPNSGTSATLSFVKVAGENIFTDAFVWLC